MNPEICLTNHHAKRLGNYKGSPGPDVGGVHALAAYQVVDDSGEKKAILNYTSLVVGDASIDGHGPAFDRSSEEIQRRNEHQALVHFRISPIDDGCSNQ